MTATPGTIPPSSAVVLLLHTKAFLRFTNKTSRALQCGKGHGT